MKKLDEILDLRGKTCVLTGAANGIGAATAYRLAEAGAQMILLDMDEKNLSKVLKKVKYINTKMDHQSFALDLSEKTRIDAFWKDIETEDPDILINNAGMFPFIDFLKLTEEKLLKVMQVNLFSTLWMCQAFIKKRLKKGGIIINFGSIEAILPFKKDLSHYSLSKIGVITLTRDLAKEYAGKGFKVNVLLPGCIFTKGTREAAIKAIRTLDIGLLKDGYLFKNRVPASELGRADDVALTVLSLCTDMTRFIHGAIIPVDGGFLCG